MVVNKIIKRGYMKALQQALKTNVKNCLSILLAPMPMRREGKCMRGKGEKCILFVGTGPTHPSPFQRRMEKTQKRTTSTPRNQGRRNNDKTKLMFVRSRVVKLRPRGSFTTRAWSKSDWICSDLVV